MKIKFENFSVSGIFREYAGFTLNLPGHAIADKAVIVDVPDELVEDISRFLSTNHPAVAIEENPAEADGFAVYGDQAEADRVAAEKAAEEAKEIEAAELAAAEAKVKEEADQAEADRVAAEKAAATVGGKKK